jgi:hypothetical protein
MAVEETPKVKTELRSECFRLTNKFQQPVTATECMLTERQISENIFSSGNACYHSCKHLMSSRLSSKHINNSIYKLSSLLCKQTSVGSEMKIIQN